MLGTMLGLSESSDSAISASRGRNGAPSSSGSTGRWRAAYWRREGTIIDATTICTCVHVADAVSQRAHT